MTPGPSVDEVPNGCLVHPELIGYGLVGGSGSAGILDEKNLPRCEFRTWRRLTPMLATASNFVSHVVKVASEFEVHRVDALRIVALVSDRCASRYRHPICDLV